MDYKHPLYKKASISYNQGVDAKERALITRGRLSPRSPTSQIAEYQNQVAHAIGTLAGACFRIKELQEEMKGAEGLSDEDKNYYINVAMAERLRNLEQWLKELIKIESK